jgi:amidase
MDRRELLKAAVWGSVAAALPAWAASGAASEFPIEEATLDQLQAAMANGSLTALALTKLYLARIAQMDTRGPALRSFLETNPEALAQAEALDAERKAKGPRGPLHGIPVGVKDNLETHDRMETTAGSLALLGVPTLSDAPAVAKLRAAGAIILGKTNLSEWANLRSSQASSGWSARGGLCANPYVLDRTPSGSSSGSGAALAANLCAVAVGTETDGSILSPSAVMGLVGLKPTVGLVSRPGVIPISKSQDTPGPMARTVRDAALLLNALVSADPDDPATAAAGRRVEADYAAGLSLDGLKGSRLGVVRALVGQHTQTTQRFDAALEVLKRLGAEVLEVKLDGKPVDDPELDVLLYEMKDGMARYLAKRRPASPHKSLADLIAFNRKEAAREMRWFAQELFERAEAKGPLSTPDYVKARAFCLEQTRAHGIDAALAKHRLDALLGVSGGPACGVDLIYGDRSMPGGMQIPAVAGYPSISVPMGEVDGLPVGRMLFAGAWSEAKLFKLAYAYEQATHHRKPPAFKPTLGLERG